MLRGRIVATGDLFYSVQDVDLDPSQDQDLGQDLGQDRDQDQCGTHVAQFL